MKLLNTLQIIEVNPHDHHESVRFSVDMLRKTVSRKLAREIGEYIHRNSLLELDGVSHEFRLNGNFAGIFARAVYPLCEKGVIRKKELIVMKIDGKTFNYDVNTKEVSYAS